MSGFKIERAWLGSGGSGSDAATLAKLKITVGDQIVTAYRGDAEKPAEGVEIPIYYLAEWIAENWWPLLWEPRKNDDQGDNADFLSRHSTLTAQHGFALPKITVVSHGEQITLTARARNVPYADVRFYNNGNATLNRQAVEGELRKFISGVVERLKACGVDDTSLQEEWRLIENTDEEEAEFCRLMGALGLSPYAADDRIASMLERANELHGSSALMDLCLSSTAENFRHTLELANKAAALTREANAATLEPLRGVPIPADVMAHPGYRRGINAAKAIRAALGIKDTDPGGSFKLFDQLHIDTGRSKAARDEDLISEDEASFDPSGSENAPIVGAVATDDMHPRIALLQKGAPQRRFTAARGAYLAWTADRKHFGNRLLTMALTRDQQASRGFAAEIMVPLNYLRRYSNKSRISVDDVFEIAQNLGASPDLVRKQAQNNGIEPSY